MNNVQFIQNTIEYPSLYNMEGELVVICPKLPSKTKNELRLSYADIKQWKAWKTMALPDAVQGVTLTTNQSIDNPKHSLDEPCFSLKFELISGCFQVHIAPKICVEYGKGYIALYPKIMTQILSALLEFITKRRSLLAYSDGDDAEIYRHLAHQCQALNFNIDIDIIRELASHHKEQITPALLQSFIDEHAKKKEQIGEGDLTKEQLFAVAMSFYIQKNIQSLGTFIDLLYSIHITKQKHPSTYLNSFVSLCLAEIDVRLLSGQLVSECYAQNTDEDTNDVRDNTNPT